mgnify:CR=1 FL=1
MHIDPDDVRRGFGEAPLRRVKAELLALFRTVVFHDENNNVRKGATIAIVGVWAVIEAGSAFDVATPPDQFFYLRLFVGILVGRMWGIEINNIAGVDLSFDAQSGKQNDND